MNNINKQCLVCDGENIEHLLHFFSPFVKKLFHRLGICKNCGHIQVYPLFDEDEYEKINNKFFRHVHITTNKITHLANNEMKTAEVDQWLSPFMKKNINVLDFGPGEAWLLDYCNVKKANYFSIEVVPHLIDLIKKRGGEVIDDNDPDYNSFFDIIVFRGVIEHLRHPKDTLLKLRILLKETGLLYTMLPNTGKLDLKQKGYRVSYIRPVHLSYFNEGNFLRIVNETKLKVHKIESTNLIRCLLYKASTKDNSYDYQNYYTIQKNIFLKTAKESFFNDYFIIGKKILKIGIKKVLQIS